MVVKGIEIIHARMLEILDYVHSICVENDLHYFLDGGTLIGAVRHNGFIPWDDDIDISMIKQDYLKLLKILKEKNGERFFFYFDDFEHHCCTYLAINTDYWQGWSKSKFPVLYPIKLDIRPINVIQNTDEEKKKNLIYRKTAEYLIFGKYENQDKSVIDQVIFEFGNKENFLSYYNQEYGVNELSENTVLSYPYLSYAKTDVLPYDYIGGYIEHDFEIKELGYKVYIPKNYDNILTILYGKYMKLPPEKNRVSYCQALYRINNSKRLMQIYKYRLYNKKVSIFKKICYRLTMAMQSKLVK